MKKQKRNIGSGEDATPGIWYYVWLKTKWDFFCELGPQANHYEYWDRHIVPMLKQKYRIKDWNTIGALSMLPHSMPRGRVVECDDGTYKVAHGDDPPKGVSQRAILARVTDEFGLGRLAVLNKVEFGLHKHETMDPKQQATLQGLIEVIVPYGE